VIATKVLLLSPFFYPEAISTGKYNTALAEALVRAGAEVQVICSHPLYPAWEPVSSDKTLDHVSIVRGGKWVRYPRAMMLRRLVFETWYAFHALWTIWLRRFQPDIVLAVFPPTLFFCLAPLFFPSAARRVGIVHDFQSTLGFGQNDGFVCRQLRRIVRAIDRKSLHSCQTLIVLSQAMARVAIHEYAVSPNRVVVAYPFVTLKPRTGSQAKLMAVLPDGVQHVVYSGALGRKQNPFALFDFFRIAAGRLLNVEFHIFSEGPVFDELCRIHTASPLARLKLHRLVPEADLGELYSRSTIQVIPQIAGSADACLPSKLPNIVASGCGILAICDANSELAHLVSQCSGLSISSWEPDTLIIQLEKLLEVVKRQSADERRSVAEPIVSNYFSLDRVLDAVLTPEYHGTSLGGVPPATLESES